MVGDRQPGHAVLGQQADVDGRLRRGVHQSVANKVAEHLAEAGVVAVHDDPP